MKLIVGLGNPGKKYELNRHNLGHVAIDALADKMRVNLKKDRRTFSENGDFFYNNQKVMLAKPHTFMNESGHAVRALISFYKIKSHHLWVIYDDVDLPLGKIRYRAKGSSGGHKGIQSIIDVLGTGDFNRIRIGIGSNRDRNMPAEKYVLQNFTQSEKKVADKAIVELIKNLPDII